MPSPSAPCSERENVRGGLKALDPQVGLTENGEEGYQEDRVQVMSCDRRWKKSISYQKILDPDCMKPQRTTSTNKTLSRGLRLQRPLIAGRAPNAIAVQQQQSLRTRSSRVFLVDHVGARLQDMNQSLLHF
jgi:hypothetical protein